MYHKLKWIASIGRPISNDIIDCSAGFYRRCRIHPDWAERGGKHANTMADLWSSHQVTCIYRHQPTSLKFSPACSNEKVMSRIRPIAAEKFRHSACDVGVLPTSDPIESFLRIQTESTMLSVSTYLLLTFVRRVKMGRR